MWSSRDRLSSGISESVPLSRMLPLGSAALGSHAKETGPDLTKHLSAYKLEPPPFA